MPEIIKTKQPSIFLSGMYSKSLLLIFSVLIPVLFIQMIIYMERFETRRNDEKQANLQVARGVAETFEQFVQNILDQELSIGLMLASMNESSPEMLQSVFKKITRENAAIRNIGWTDLNGKILYFSDSPILKMDISSSPTFRKIVDGGEWSISPLFISPVTSLPVFTIDRAIRNDARELVGVFIFVIDCDQLGIIFPIKKGLDRSIILVDHRGNLVYHEPPMKLDWKNRNLAAVPEIHAALAGKEVIGERFVPRHNKEHIFGYTPIPGIGWVAGASISNEVAYRSVFTQLKKHAILFIIVFLFSLLCVYLYTVFFIIRPIKALQEYAISLKGHDLKKKMDPSGPLEFKILGHTLNEMVEELKTAREELEQKVKERTKELTLSTQSLQKHARDLEFRNQELKEFMHIASHDLREPLRKVKLFVGIFKKEFDGTLTVQHRDNLKRIILAIQRMEDLIQSLKQYSKVIKTDETFEPVDLNQIIFEIKNSMVEIIQKDGIEIITDRLPTVQGVYDQVRLLFQHLINNAITFQSDKPPMIRISYLGIEDGFCRIGVQDNGIGFDEKYKDTIFRPFQQLSGKYGKYKGTGIGLAICRKIMGHHNGTISATSTPGEGSTFIVRFPLKQPQNTGSELLMGEGNDSV